MSNRSNYTKPVAPLQLDTLPDFMRSPNQQVKFHSAFPPLTTKVRVRGVMERAGFDVYKPEKDRSISSGTKSPKINDFYHGDNGQFHPPNKFHSNRSSSSSQKSPNRVPLRSYSHNQVRIDTSYAQNGEHRSHISDNNLLPERFQNPSGKTRNFTTNPSNNSTPNLVHTFDKASHSSANSPVDSNSSPSSQIKKKNSILSYARQRLNLHTSKQNKSVPSAAPLNEQDYQSAQQGYPEPVVPNLTLSDTPRDTLDSDLEYGVIDRVKLEPSSPLTEKAVFTNDSTPLIQETNIENEHEQNQQTEYLNSSVAMLDRQVPQVGGPRPYYDSDSNSNDEDQPEIPFNFGTDQRSAPMAPSFANNNTQALQSDVHSDNPFAQDDTTEQQTKLYAPEQGISQAQGVRSSSQSFGTASSVESFDEKFMLQANDNGNDGDETNDLSQETLGGLGGLRKTIQSTEGDPNIVAMVPNLKNPYSEGSKRISTLGTNDMKIYNLQSLDTNNLDEQGARESNDGTANYNDINEMSVIQEGESEDYRSSLDMNEFRKSNDVSEMSRIPENSGVAQVPIVTINRDSSCEDYDNVSFKDAEQGDYEPDENMFKAERPSVAGFTEHNANVVDTPNSSSNPFLPESDSPQTKTPNVNNISDLINDIDNFGLTSEVPNNDSELYQNDQVSNESSERQREEVNEEDVENFEIPPRHFEKQQQLQVQHQHQHQQSQGSPAVSTSDTELTHTCSHPYASLSHNSNTPSFSSAPLRMSSGFTTPDKEVNFDENKYNVATGSKELYYPPGEGPCRKCGDIILDSEKKIWSKDNQLSGQWHRSCFGCHKCGSKFNKGSSCYVYGDQPYCERHFHELNGSLCRVCNKGVEGECLQNEVNEVFHIDCLKCVICGLNVEGDYFIFRDEVMCEADAKELMYQIEEAEKEYQGKDVEKMIKRRTRVLYL